MNGWITPTGEFYECGLMGHAELAYEITVGKELKRTGLESDILELMYNNGYREVRTWPNGKTWFLPEDKRWSSIQVRKAVDICIDLEIEIPEVLYG